MAGVGFQAFGHFQQHILEGFDRDFRIMVVQDFDKTRHVRALKIVGQFNEHVEIGDGVLLALAAVLHTNRVTNILDADLVDRDATSIRRVLHIGNRDGFRFGFGFHYELWVDAVSDWPGKV